MGGQTIAIDCRQQEREIAEGENETGRWERESPMVIFRVDFPFVCGAAQERHRRRSSFQQRWPSARNGPSEGDVMGQADGDG